MIRAIQPIQSAFTHMSAGPANAYLVRRYTQFADAYYAAPGTGTNAEPAVTTGLPLAPLTRALPNLKSAGVFSYLRAPRKGAAAGAAKLHGAALRAPAQAAAEPPPMPGMTHGDARIDAIHDDSRKDSPLATDRTQRARTPTATGGGRESEPAPAAQVSHALGGGDNAARARSERNRAIMNLLVRPGGEFYRAFSGAYAA
ncbi:hypothetical protein J8I26_04380 [Herbaspirillum sp. LeCh32-8]|uniref:hypothetical protein n=1 Tax=Herbaspirillum sp. LeCh32-8 TaxID=2821356 RepID=UPI001AE7F5A7|nr:hypothetical protein [Herbaspirillum sp. LeCh32-8]MBP0597328.1 hypothetical protein [Herbaspirillum sp. LeCh32-8]